MTESDGKKAIRIIIFAALIISILAIYQYFLGFKHLSEYMGQNKISDPFIIDYVNRSRAFFPFITPNTLGGYLAMIIPLALVYKYRIAYLVPLCLALLLTKSLGALLSLLLGLIIYASLRAKFEKKRLFLLGGLIIIIALVFVTRSAAPKQHFQPIFSTIMRLNYWKDSLGIIKNHLFTGVGIGNFNLLQSRYAHNSYLQIWAEMGTLGIVSFLWLITFILKYSLQNIKFSLNSNQITCLITASMVFLIHNFLDFSFFLPEVSLIWWIILGCNLSFVGKAETH